MTATLHLTAEQLAGELGRSTDWLYAHWKRLAHEGRIPRPILGADSSGPLTWSAAQVYALLDKPLTPPQRAAAAAYRIALAAYAAGGPTSEAAEIAASRARLAARRTDREGAIP